MREPDRNFDPPEDDEFEYCEAWPCDAGRECACWQHSKKDLEIGTRFDVSYNKDCDYWEREE